MDDTRLGADRLLKTTGIAIALGGVLEDGKKLQDAAMVYADALDEVLQRGEHKHTPPVPRTDVERMRGVALAQKIGELAQEDGVLVPPFYAPGADPSHTNKPAEGYLTWSVEEMLRLIGVQPSKDAVVLSDLPLPPWVSSQDLGASVEALGAFYANQGIAEYAVPLYVQSISTLLPPKPAVPPTVADRCRAAILMNNISQALTQSKTDAETLQQAIAWAAKGLDLATLTSYRAGFLQDVPTDEVQGLLGASGLDPGKVGAVAPVIETSTVARLQQVKQQCLGAQFVLLYNLGMFYSVRCALLT